MEVGLLFPQKAVKNQEKIINECTQVALINDSGLVLALTDKLDAKQRHRLKASSSLNSVYN